MPLDETTDAPDMPEKAPDAQLELPLEPFEPESKPEPTHDEAPKDGDDDEAVAAPKDDELPAAPDAEPASGAPSMPEDVPTPEPEEKAPEEKVDDAEVLGEHLKAADELIPGLKGSDSRLHGALMELEEFLRQFRGKLKGAIDGTLAGL